MSTVLALAHQDRAFMEERIEPGRRFWDRVLVPRLFVLMDRFDHGGWPTRDAAAPDEDC